MKDFKDIYKLKNKKKHPENVNLSREELIVKAINFHSKGNISEATKYYQYCISKGFNDHRVLSNYGVILKNSGELRQAEKFLRKAIKIKPDFANAYSNLGNTLKALGSLKEAEIFLRKAIEIKPDFAIARSNLGSILGDLGKSKEAELFLRKAIEINPDFADAHLNLGNILRDIGKFKEAEMSFRKAIEIKPDLAIAYSNLGNTLKDLGQQKAAEISYRKAIEIKPDLAIAYSNLGNLLKDLGKLESAEKVTRKAIQLNPELADAHLNLGFILFDLGKINELIYESQTIIDSVAIDEGYKLIAYLRIAIGNLLIQNFEGTNFCINKINDLILKGALNFIKNENNKQYSLSYFNFIKSLYPLLEKKFLVSNKEKIPHIGESHCLSFSHQKLNLESKLKKIQPILITGGKAWHFANSDSNRFKNSLTEQIKNHLYSEKVFISFGEIDCRKNEGILPYTIKNNKEIKKVCKETIIGFLNFMENNLAKIFTERYYFGVPAPFTQNESNDHLDKKRIEIIKNYNYFYKKEVLSRGCFFLDVYELTVSEKGTNNNLYMCDETHLSPKSLNILFKNHFYKS